MWRFLLPTVLFAALVTFFAFGLHRDKETLPSPLIGKSAPIFTLPHLEDASRTVSNAEFAGQPYVVNIWGSWCVGCRQEHQTLLEIARRNQVPIIGVNWKDGRAAALQWLQTLGNPYAQNAFDGEGRVAIDWGAYGAPETFLVDAQGTVVYKHVAPLTLDIWEREFLPLIGLNARSGAAQ